MIEGTLIIRAAGYAAALHSTQRRAGTIAEPYVNHVIRVADAYSNATVTATGNAPPPYAVAAALLHDVAEDTSATIPIIRADFGDAVADLVADLTDLPEWSETMPPEIAKDRVARMRWSEETRARRKAKQADKIRRARPRAALIKLADQRDNVEGHAAELSRLLQKLEADASKDRGSETADREPLLRRSASYASTAAVVARACASNPYARDDAFAGTLRLLNESFRAAHENVRALLQLLAGPAIDPYLCGA